MYTIILGNDNEVLKITKCPTPEEKQNGVEVESLTEEVLFYKDLETGKLYYIK